MNVRESNGQPGLEADAYKFSTTEIGSLGTERIAFSQALSLKRIADAVEELTVIASAPQPEIVTSDDGWRDRVNRVMQRFDDSFIPEVNAAIMKRAPHPLDTMQLHPGKTTSPEMAALAAKYMGMSDNDFAEAIFGSMGTANEIAITKMIPAASVIEHRAFYADIRSLAASVLSQRADE